MSTTSGLKAISVDDFKKYGCPHCGCHKKTNQSTKAGTTWCICGNSECGGNFFILEPGVTESYFVNDGIHTPLEPHPLAGKA